jgi:predicted dehydrogenase
MLSAINKLATGTHCTNPSSPPVQVALIGLGIAGTVFHTPLVLSLPSLFTLRYVVDITGDPTADKDAFVRKYGPDAKFTSKFEDVLSDPEVEIVRLPCLNDLPPCSSVGPSAPPYPIT